MSTDFAALTGAVAAGLPDVRVCLLVSRDGLALGVHPAEEEARAVDVWARLGSLGEVERGFVVVGAEQWVFCHRGPYGALAVATGSARAGVVLDHLEQMLLVAEESRARREAARPGAPEQSTADIPRGPRTPLHRDARPAGEPSAAPRAGAPGSAGTQRPAPRPTDAPAPQAPPAPKPEPEVDKIALAREFAGLFRVAERDDEERGTE